MVISRQPLAQESHERDVRIVAVELHGDAPAFERCADSASMTPLGGRLRWLRCSGLSPSARSARAGFGPRVIVRSFAEPRDETRLQRRLVLVDARQDAREAFAGDQHEIVEAAVGELHGEREHLPRCAACRRS